MKWNGVVFSLSDARSDRENPTLSVDYDGSTGIATLRSGDQVLHTTRLVDAERGVPQFRVSVEAAREGAGARAAIRLVALDLR